MDARKFETQEEYIAAQVPEMRASLQEIRQLAIQTLPPEAEEVISYNMPAFKYHGIIIYFAAFKKHYSVFFRPLILQQFHEETKDYVHGKSAMQIPLGQKPPKNLLKKMLRHTVQINLEKARLKKKK